ncbi:MAG: tetratricopeptide repeat protein, partial [Anaerolineales bacterium]
RVLQLTLSVALLFALGPTPVSRGLAEHLWAGVHSLQIGQPDRALNEFEQALQLEPDLSAAHLLAAQSAVLLGDPAGARAHLEARPGTAEAGECLEVAVSLALGELAEAVDRLAGAESECLSQIPEIELAIDGFMLTGEPEAGLAFLKQMTALQPGWAHFRLGQWYAVREPELALSHLALAGELDPQSAGYLNQLIRVIETARQNADRSFSLAQVGQFMARSGDWSLAAAAFSNALAIQPDYTEARAYLGLALDQSGADGLEHLEKAAEEAPEAALPQELLGKHWRIQGDVVHALRAFERAAILAPEDPLIAVDLAAAYVASGDLISAKAAYLHAAELAAGEPLYWTLLAQFSLDHEIEVETLGLPAARRVVMLNPGRAEALDLLGYCHYLLGNWALAGRMLSGAIEANPHLASGHYHLGLLQLVLGDLASGRRALQTASQLDAGGWVGNLARRSLENLAP